MWQLLQWLMQNWKIITLILLVGFMISMVKPITNALRNLKESFKEMFTPLGAFVTLILIAFAIFLIYAYNSGWFIS